jgi:hypothetical protein
MCGFPFPAKAVGTLEGAKFTINQWWASNSNFGTSRASAATATWARLENLRPLVDPVTGDVTAAEKSARQAGTQSTNPESADLAALREQENADAAAQAAALRASVNNALQRSGFVVSREEEAAAARVTRAEKDARDLAARSCAREEEI